MLGSCLHLNEPLLSIKDSDYQLLKKNSVRWSQSINSIQLNGGTLPWIRIWPFPSWSFSVYRMQFLIKLSATLQTQTELIKNLQIIILFIRRQRFQRKRKVGKKMELKVIEIPRNWLCGNAMPFFYRVSSPTEPQDVRTEACCKTQQLNVLWYSRLSQTILF